MNLRIAAIAASLAANVLLVGFVLSRPELTPSAISHFMARDFWPAPKPSLSAVVKGAAFSRPSTPLWATLPTDDLPSLVSRLLAAGFPAEVIREIMRVRVNDIYQARLAALTGPDSAVPFWRNAGTSPREIKRAAEIGRIERERNQLLNELLAGDFFAAGEVTSAERRRFGDLPRPKVDALQRIEDDYAEMLARVKAGMNGIKLPEDRATFDLIKREKEADLASVLTPEELAEYTVRSSPTTDLLRHTSTGFTPTETEFRALYDQQRTFSEKHGWWVDTMSRSREEFDERRQVLLETDKRLKQQLGEARYNEFSRGTSTEFQQLRRLTAAEGLPEDDAVRAFALRDQVARESNRVFDDDSFDVEQKRAEIISLAQKTRAQLLAILGPKTGAAYAKVADAWLSPLDRGDAIILWPALSFNYGPDGTPTAGLTGNRLVNRRSLPPAAPTRP